MKILLKILGTIIVIPFCIALGLIAGLFACGFLPIYFCVIVIQDVWMN